MEVYTLDPLLRRTELFEDHESLIWTDRFQKYGDFEWHTSSSLRARTLLKPGTLLAMNGSKRVMKIETVEDASDSDNRRMLSIKGRSIETMLYDRMAIDSLTPDTPPVTTPPTPPSTFTWDISGLTAMNVARKIFHDICMTGMLSPYDALPFMYEGTFAEASNIAESIDVVNVKLEPTTVYDAIAQLAETWNFGFRIMREGDSSKLWFSVYTGADRTTGQGTLPAVVFSPQLDNLQNTKELFTIEGAKNVAYVYCLAGFQIVYADDVDGDISGFDRKVLMVNASDITAETHPVTEARNAALIQRGYEELSKHQTYQAFDGEISQTSTYQPGRDYNVGDLVEMRSSDGVANQMRVSEIIYASDAEGDRSYPTLSMNKYINTGSWLSWLNNKMWSELGPEEWDDQP